LGERLVVVGGDAAGMSAASQARRRRSADDLEIIAFERGPFTSYSACGIPYYIGGVVSDLNRLVTRTPQDFRERFAIDARTKHEVIAIDLDRGRVRVRSIVEERERWESFDHLVIATGATAVRPLLPGSDAHGIFGVQVLDDGREIHDVMDSRAPRTAVVVGGGYIGLEMAEAFQLSGLEVAVVELAAEPMSTLDPDMGSLVADAMREMGIAVYTEEPVEGFESSQGWVSAVVTATRRLPADIVALGLGVEPNAELARSAGIEVGESGAIAVDRRMRAGGERVWAAGDCAEKFHRVSRQPVSIALGTHANKEGRVAGINIGGGYATFPGVLGTAVSKVANIEMGRTGLNEHEASATGFEALGVIVESTTRAGYYPGAMPIKTKLIVEVGSGRLLGAQIVGREGAAKRIDVLAAALWNEMSVDELQSIDLSYAPPFSPVWDPVLIAARKAEQRVEEAAGDRS
jgi:NADPH-dependent 2,4-dienoyl-CoA reductase/sulfur reductase-like enzyme